MTSNTTSNFNGSHHYTYLSDSNSSNLHLNQPLWKHPWLRTYPKTYLAAIGLTFIGIVFLWVSFITFWMDPLQALAFFITSLVTLGPGSYVSFYLLQAMKGHPDYPLSSIPLFDN